MKPYNILFYLSYLTGIRTHNYEDAPIAGGLGGVCLIMPVHIGTVYFLLASCGVKCFDFILKDERIGMLFCIIYFLIITFYYWYHGRYKRIIEKYSYLEHTFLGRHPVFSTYCIFFFSMAILFLSAMFYHKEGVFSFLQE